MSKRFLSSDAEFIKAEFKKEKLEIPCNIYSLIKEILDENAELKKRFNDIHTEFDQYLTLMKGVMKELVANRARLKELEGIEGIEYREDESNVFINK